MAVETRATITVWLDYDPGHDDVFAILLAAYHPQIRLLGVSTVFGNASLEQTTRNAASVLTALGRPDIPLHVGHSKALVRPAIHAATKIYGASGLDGTKLLPEPACRPSTVPAVEAMNAALRREPAGSAYIVATGALTNVSALLRAHPDLVSHIKGLTLMGGSFGGFSDAPMGLAHNKAQIGNVSPWAEFNILTDPEAAAHIFHTKEIAIKTTVVPLDLSHQVLATDQVRQLLLYGPDSERAGPGKTNLRTMLVELLYFFAKTYSDVHGITAGPPLHDPIAVAAVLIGTASEIPFAEWDAFRSAAPRHNERFDVITDGSVQEAQSGETQTGRTLSMVLPAGEDGVRIPRSIDVPMFRRVIKECIQRADVTIEAMQETC